MKVKFFEKDGYISPSIEEVYCMTGDSDLDPTCYEADAFNLFNGRHEMPIKCEAVFADDIDPMDFWGLEITAKKVLKSATTGKVVVYVTGLTSATIAVVNVARKLGKELVLMHYNRNTGDYNPQWVY